VTIGGLNGANLYGLNRRTGKIKWTTRLGPDSLSAIFGSPTKVRNYVAVGVASNEETATMDPTYKCCRTRGSLALVDPKDGTVVWQTYTLPPAGPYFGRRGNGVRTFRCQHLEHADLR
jgi:polyvinyl alcohol dehydrogenase (cytochrome)